MRTITIDFTERDDGKCYVDVTWSPTKECGPRELILSESFKPVLDLAIRAVLPAGVVGFSQSDSIETARMGAQIDRDIQTAGGEK